MVIKSSIKNRKNQKETWPASLAALIIPNYIKLKRTCTEYECTAEGLKLETCEYANDFKFNYSIEDKILTLETYDGNLIMFIGAMNFMM